MPRPLPLLRGAEGQFRVPFLLIADVPRRPCHEYRIAVAVLRQIALVEVGKALERCVRALQPARCVKGGWFQNRLNLVLRLQPRDQHVELQLAHDADDPLRADLRIEYLDHAFL